MSQNTSASAAQGEVVALAMSLLAVTQGEDIEVVGLVDPMHVANQHKFLNLCRAYDWPRVSAVMNRCLLLVNVHPR